MFEKELFTEKYRKKKLNQVILVPRIKNILEKGITNNFIFSGQPGCGKTTTAKILAKDYTSLFINASEENGIDTIREKINNFCSTISLEDGAEKIKVVVLDELDGATDSFFEAFRGVVEKYSKTARFICTCNYINKIPTHALSRFDKISFDPENKEEEDFLINKFIILFDKIFKYCKIECEPQITEKLVRKNFPDTREIYHFIQRQFNSGVKKITDELIEKSYNFNDLFQLTIESANKPYENYKLVTSEYAARIDAAFVAFGVEFPNYFKDHCGSKINKLPQIIIAIAEHQYQKQFVIDPMVTLLSLIYKIQLIINN